MSAACPHCGWASNPADAKFCRSCGGSLAEGPARAVTDQAPPQDDESRARPPWRRRLAVAGAGGLLLVASVVAAYLIGYAAGDDSDRIAELEGELAKVEEERDAAEDERDAAEKAAEALEKDLAAAEQRVQDLSGAEETLVDGTAGLGEVQTVSQGSQIKLEEMTATLDSWETTDVVSDEFDSRRADGVFVVATITLGNRLNSKVTVDPEEAFLLVVGSRQFNPDFDAMNYAGGDRSWLDIGLDGIQPGTSVTGTVIFDIAPSSAKKLEAEGMVIAKQFSDAEFLSGSPELPVAGLKLAG